MLRPRVTAPIVKEGTRFIETAGRNPGPYMAQLKSAGIIKEKYFQVGKQR